ncbi:TonB family protein [Methylocystis sp. MJC1]|jgi:protein TonB|uniref:TonB family protein n=1 Tax=Methylocystis sp. MJC1 TaxID=2654282 RepID=UPI0013EBABDA|nr:energy transducer TonB [Methylocystis sp. MJC1]KAF2990031.1 hypothetical protein MJC1_02948 [Methylocystis sp. MJC1]MBU6528768.1 energy transducer TonB [Methylocystis sp. MJC1]UZX11654.1 TonB family protein [Methylocystis sp. MJC1]
MTNNPQFNLYHGIAGSLALHSLALFILWGAVQSSTSDIDDTLVVEFQGVDSDVQAEEKNKQQNSGAGGAVDAQNAKQEEQRQQSEKTATDDDAFPERIKKEGNEGAKAAASAQQTGRDVDGRENEQRAQVIQRRTDEQGNALKAYIHSLSKKIQAKLIYPKEARHSGLQGVTTVSFRILEDGAMHPASLKIVASSGQTELDMSALDTVRACAPFVAPPRDMTVTMAVTYGRKR